VIDVHRDDGEPACPGEREQRKRVGAARAADDHAGSGRKVVEMLDAREPRRDRAGVKRHAV